jgi:hypothetical protein
MTLYGEIRASSLIIYYHVLHETLTDIWDEFILFFFSFLADEFTVSIQKTQDCARVCGAQFGLLAAAR